MEALILKDKSVGLIILSFVPSSLILTATTKGFQTPIHFTDLILPVSIQIVLLAGLWYYTVNRPTKHFLSTMNRAINGDFRARFSCNDHNSNFKKLSCAFNQLMSSIENQTQELRENRILQNQLYENEKIYRSALELSCERIFEADLSHNRMVYGLSKYCQTFPFLHTEMYDQVIHSIAENAVFHEDSLKFYEAFSRSGLLEAFRKPGVMEVTMEYRLKTPDPTWHSASVVFLNSKGNDDLKIIGYVKNIDAHKKQEIEILKQSQKDGLTGLYNKKVTQTMIDAFLAGEGKNGRHAVIMIDIDNFKKINDTLGHSQGDAALLKIAQKIQSLFRASDIAGRIGGDEFLILMKNVDLGKILQEKLKLIGEYFHEIRLEDESYRVNGSIGVSIYPDDGTTYDSLYKKSDIALYYSKAHGKNRFYFYGGRYNAENDRSDSPNLKIIDQNHYIQKEKQIGSDKQLKIN